MVLIRAVPPQPLAEWQLLFSFQILSWPIVISIRDTGEHIVSCFTRTKPDSRAASASQATTFLARGTQLVSVTAQTAALGRVHASSPRSSIHLTLSDRLCGGHAALLPGYRPKWSGHNCDSHVDCTWPPFPPRLSLSGCLGSGRVSLANKQETNEFA